MQLIAYGVAALIGIAAFVIAIGSARWKRATSEVVRELESSARQPQETISLVSLPAPVARYLRAVFDGKPPLVRHARLTQAGQFRMAASETSWRPFRATQHVNLSAPGFVWDARIEMAPLIPVRVRDAYLGGRGTMLGKVLSVVTVVNEHDKPELASGALVRYLAEAAWFPTALLPSASLRWQAIDDHHAQATLTDAGINVSAEFQFNDAGDIIAVAAERYRELDGTYVPTPWRGRFWNHTRRGPTRIPLEGEVAWMLPAGEHVYWRGKIIDVKFS